MLVLASALAISLACGGQAAAATIVVTTRADVVADDGRCSLREAVSAANRDASSGRMPGECIAGERPPILDVIQLHRGRYKLTRAPLGDDANVGGDLDVTESAIIQGVGRRTVILSRIGDPAVAGDGDRLFHVDPSGVGGVDVTFAKLTLARGDVGCTGRDCEPGGSAVDAHGADALTFEGCSILHNVASCSGEHCGGSSNGAAIQGLFGSALQIHDTTIRANRSHCTGEGCAIGGAAIAIRGDGSVSLAPGAPAQASIELILDDSTVTQNTSRCDGRGCAVGSIVSIAGESFAGNAVHLTSNDSQCNGDGCSSEGIAAVFVDQRDATLDGVEVADNVTACVGEQCFVGSVLDLQGRGSVALRTATVTNNDCGCRGVGCFVDAHAVIGGALDATLEGVALTFAKATCTGDDCSVDPLLRAESDGALDATGVQIDENQHACGANGDTGCAVRALAILSGAPVKSTTGELLQNSAGCQGDGCRAGSLLQIAGRGDSLLSHAVIQNNLLDCSGVGCAVDDGISVVADDGALTIEETAVDDNTTACGGRSCAVAGLLDASAHPAFTFRNTRLARNTVRCVGDLCQAAGAGTLLADELAIASGTFDQNAASCQGSGCRVAVVLTIDATDGSLANSLVTSNSSTCSGEDCAAGPGGALRNGGTRLSIADTIMKANVTDGEGAAIFNDAGSTLLLTRTALLGNQAGLRGTMEFGGFGGAVFNDASKTTQGVLTLVDTRISSNGAQKSGGGVLNAGKIDLIVRTDISGNAIGNCVNRGGTGCP
jgi:CSLREA domain-containing protein